MEFLLAGSFQISVNTFSQLSLLFGKMMDLANLFKARLVVCRLVCVAERSWRSTP